MCYSAAPSTTNQDATQRIYIYIKDIKWLGKSLQAYSIKMQYEDVFKSDRWCLCYTCLPQSAPAEGGSWYSSEGSTSTHDRNAKTRSSTYTYMQTKANAKKQYNNT